MKPDYQPGDYYVENGFLVMAEQFLKRRGFCCGNECRHCPYEPRAEYGTTTLASPSGGAQEKIPPR
ncbi:hypothetical protein BH09SUM1_BH09SUM1_24850 [soil metagenome]